MSDNKNFNQNSDQEKLQKMIKNHVQNLREIYRNVETPEDLKNAVDQTEQSYLEIQNELLRLKHNPPFQDGENI